MDETPRPLDRALSWLQATPAEAAGLVVLLVGALVATALLLWQAQQRPDAAAPGAGVGASVPVSGVDDQPDESGAFATGGPDGGAHESGEHADGVAAAPSRLVVHVTGAVVRPGVVTLDVQARVTDAIEAAGGATAEARVESLNLARPLQDGEHVHLPREGEEPPPTAAGDDAGAGSGPVDLNHAGVEQLETLPGIGPAKAADIVRHRDEHGPFGAPGDLRDVPGIGEATFQRLADLVTVS